MQIRLLGPVEIWIGGQPARLGGVRPRTVLAVLAMAAGRPVPTAHLTDEMWAEPPVTARQQIHSAVSALRRLVGDAIETTPGAYRLAVPGEDVDVTAFELRVAAARAAAASGRPETAVDLLTQALRLWRGPALGGVSGLTAQKVRLEERRLAVLEERVGLELDLGRHLEVVAELAELVEANPLREALVGQLMVALYRGGRTADALEVYRRAERRLADELGLDPGPELKRHELAILRADPALDPPGARPAGPPAGVAVVSPAQLPPDTPDFTGRDGVLRALDALLPTDEAGPRATVVAALVGTAGVGKTALAVHWGHRVRARFPDGQLYVNLHGYATGPPLRPIEVLSRFLHALGVPAERVPVDVEEASAMYRSLVADRRLLVLLDNAGDADQVRPLLPGGSGCLVLVTSRSQLAGLIAAGGAHRLPLDVLSPAESRELLARILDAGMVRAEPGACAELAGLCAHLPLALRIAAAHLAGRPGPPGDTVARYCAELRAGDRLDALAIDEHAMVRSAFDVSYNGLQPPTRRLFRLLGLVPGTDVTADTAGALAGVPAAQAGRELARLARVHLLAEPAPGRYTFHDLLRGYAAERAARDDSAAERATALRRMDGYLLRCVDAALDRLAPEARRLPRPPPDDPADDPPDDPPFHSHSEALAWLDAERPNLVAAVLAAAEQGRHAAAYHLADALRGYLYLRVLAVDALTVGHAGLAAARTEGDLRAEAAAEIALANVVRGRGEYQRASAGYTRAIELAARSGWLSGECSARNNLGAVAWHAGRLAEAAEHHHAALELKRRLGDPLAEAASQVNLGLTYCTMGEVERAAEHSAEAVRLYRLGGSRNGEGVGLTNLGEAYHGLGRSDLAREHLARALELHREVGNRELEAATLRLLAVVEHDNGRAVRALDLAIAAAAIVDDIGDRWLEPYVLNTMGSIHRRLGAPAAAIDHHQRARRLARQSDARGPYIEALVGLAEALTDLGDLDLARARAEEGRALARHSGHRSLAERADTVLAAITSRPPGSQRVR